MWMIGWCFGSDKRDFWQAVYSIKDLLIFLEFIHHLRYIANMMRIDEEKNYLSSRDCLKISSMFIYPRKFFLQQQKILAKKFLPSKFKRNRKITKHLKLNKWKKMRWCRHVESLAKNITYFNERYFVYLKILIKEVKWLFIEAACDSAKEENVDSREIYFYYFRIWLCK